MISRRRLCNARQLAWHIATYFFFSFRSPLNRPSAGWTRRRRQRDIRREFLLKSVHTWLMMLLLLLLLLLQYVGRYLTNVSNLHKAILIIALVQHFCQLVVVGWLQRNASVVKKT
ncbi:hypothetical protein F4814DRAFT_276103 [Daldinia grandis]|nr:hypothetical protein F4814DRAFT_276103 [Daldinia grandis]